MSSTSSSRERQSEKGVVVTYGAMCDETFLVHVEPEGGSQYFQYGEMYLILRRGPSELQVLESLLSSIEPCIVFEIVSYMEFVKACSPL